MLKIYVSKIGQIKLQNFFLFKYYKEKINNDNNNNNNNNILLFMIVTYQDI